jgi:hypothetical protein
MGRGPRPTSAGEPTPGTVWKHKRGRRNLGRNLGRDLRRAYLRTLGPVGVTDRHA